MRSGLAPVIGLPLADVAQPEFQPLHVRSSALDQAHLAGRAEESWSGAGFAVIADERGYQQAGSGQLQCREIRPRR